MWPWKNPWPQATTLWLCQNSYCSHGPVDILSFPTNSMVDLSIVICKRLPEVPKVWNILENQNCRKNYKLPFSIAKGLVNVQIKHHPTIGDVIHYNFQQKCEGYVQNPQKGTLTNPCYVNVYQYQGVVFWFFSHGFPIKKSRPHKYGISWKITIVTGKTTILTGKPT